MIILATPTRDNITAGTTADIVRLCRENTSIRFLAPLGIYIGNLRNSAAEIARQAFASHLLFVDADMRFPVDALHRLAVHHKDIIAANYVQRTASQWWVSRVNGESVSSEGRTGLQEVDSVGCGFMLIRATVFENLMRPWFDTPFNGETQIGEDLYFCRKAREAGYSITIDHDLSQQVRHQGMIELGVQSQREMAVA